MKKKEECWEKKGKEFWKKIKNKQKNRGKVGKKIKK